MLIERLFRLPLVKWPALGFCVLFAGLAVWVGVRIWEYEAREPYRAAFSAVKAGDYQIAREMLLPFAEFGDFHAQQLLGQLHAHGRGGPVDSIRAQVWFRRVECGCLETGISEYRTAMQMLEGILGTRDPAGAIFWLTKSAEAGNERAQRLLADPGEAGVRGFRVDSDVVQFWKNYIASEYDSLKE